MDTVKVSSADKKSTIEGFDFYSQTEEDFSYKVNDQFEGLSEEAIWSAYKNGNKEAFVHIYHTYFPVLYNYGHQLCANSEFIKDCIQELFLDLSKKGKRLSDTDSIKFYLIKSFKNRFVRTLKNNARTKENEKFFPGYEFQFTMSAEQKIINAQLDEERINDLNKALALLTDRQREAIYYYFYENLSIDEIAEIMFVTNRRTVQNIIYRAIAYLRKNLKLSTFLLLLTFLSAGKL